MTKNKANDIQSYVFTSSDKLLLDANILLFIYGPQSSVNPNVDVYSEALKKILNSHCQVYVDVLVISEFINRYARIKHGLIKKQ